MESSPHASLMHEANLWAGTASVGLKEFRIIKDRWAACMQVMHKVKR